ncbi:MAG: hypothetical protein HOM34_06800 [Planctomycetes bacterium]|jgi:hypothetical protein|nr:hypothetical protein [Planctomycetota bacterium]MBT5120412.1 hypothetical protein [Planctomycetota bacterium]MBT7011925.1 hypothetical protein [Planctomycetota bacterium]
MAAPRRRPPKKGKTAKPAKKAKKVKVVKAEKEIKPGPPVETVLAIVTGIALFAALLVVDYEKGTHYGTGMFFKDAYQSSSAN